MTARGIPARGTRTRETRIARPRRIVVPLASYRRAQGVASSRRRTKRARAPRPVVEAKRAIARGPRINVFKPTSEPASGARPIASEARAAFTRARGTAGEMAENGGAEEAGGSTLWIGDLVRRATRERDGRAAAERYFFFPSPEERRLRRRRRRSIERSRGGWLASRRGDAARRRPSLASPLASARRRLLPLANDVADAIPLCPVSLPSSRRRRGTGWRSRIFISASPRSVRASPSHLIRRRSVSPRRVSRPLARRRRALAGERPTDARSRLASTATTGVAAAAPAPRRKRPDRFFYRRSVKTSAATACRRAREKKKRWDVD